MDPVFLDNFMFHAKHLYILRFIVIHIKNSMYNIPFIIFDCRIYIFMWFIVKPVFLCNI